MKLTKHEENKLISQGIIAVAVCTAILGIAVYFAIDFTTKQTSQAITVAATTEAIASENKKSAEEISFLKENTKKIENAWSALKGWGDGVKPSNIIPLTEAGLITQTPIPSAKIPGNQSEYGGLRVSGDRTEFQRFLSALAEVERNQGLLQVKLANLTLPQGVPPNADKATFLNITVETLAPTSK